MKKLSNRLCVCAGCLSVVGYSSATSEIVKGPGTATAYSFQAHYRTGEQHSYKIATAIYGYLPNNRPVGIEFNLKMKVLNMRGGNATIQLASDPPNSGGKVVPAPFKKATVVLDRLNRPVASSTTGQIFTMFSNHPVKIGDKWTGLSNLVLTGKKGAMVETTYQLSSVRVLNGKTIAELSMELGGLTKGNGTALVDIADGSLLSSDMRLTAAASSSKVVPIEIQLRRES